jgi:hypothetical protein
VIVNPFSFYYREGFHLSNEGFFSWFPLLLLVSLDVLSSFWGFKKNYLLRAVTIFLV